ncbi:serine carboxypeptidase [Auriscalpium vulgare]|uniref:Serine carboxypeptidase n=1 Tax=Auriscalpium vulgare TaxID=40419 RepID=A0ACB8RXJ8_9AGAM|nr:serine carboxypeptidase [Auriscalpium vulgare]
MLLTASLLVALTGTASVFARAYAEQIPFSANGLNSHEAKPPVQHFQPVGSLRNVSGDAFTTLRHPLFPAHSVRIKQSNFCDTTVKTYTGYIDFNAKHLFFYFFESRSDPDKDDVIFWTNGGPGCASSGGLFMELGPCRVTNATKGPEFFPYSWNSNANIFFVDQPVNVGFSYAEYGIHIDNTPDAAKDIAAFVAIFFEHFASFKGRPFHMAGESYGGRYIPLFASEIYDQNALLVANGLTPINLTSAMIGNGLTDWYSMLLSYYDVLCSPASVAPSFEISECVRMKRLPRCKPWTNEACVDQYDAMNCEAAMAFCQTELFLPYYNKGRNPYDITLDCEDDNGLCYPVMNNITEFLNRPDVRDTLGVDPAVASFSVCADDVGAAFTQSGDMLHRSVDYVAALLEHGVAVLAYVGAYDWVCNWVGVERFTLDMEWSGQREFGEQPLREWTLEGQVAGKARSAKGLTFATIDGAGHMAPYDKPKESLALINRWLAGEKI